MEEEKKSCGCLECNESSDYEITIKRVKNGFVLSMPITGESMFEESLIEINDDCIDEYYKENFKTDDSEKIALGRVLEQIAEYFGEYYGKYRKDNLRISYDKKGNSFED